MMFIIFGFMLAAYLLSWFHCHRLAIACYTLNLLMAIGLFLFHVYSGQYGFKMPWLSS